MLFSISISNYRNKTQQLYAHRFSHLRSWSFNRNIFLKELQSSGSYVRLTIQTRQTMGSVTMEMVPCQSRTSFQELHHPLGSLLSQDLGHLLPSFRFAVSLEGGNRFFPQILEMWCPAVPLLIFFPCCLLGHRILSGVRALSGVIKLLQSLVQV